MQLRSISCCPDSQLFVFRYTLCRLYNVFRLRIRKKGKVFLSIAFIYHILCQRSNAVLFTKKNKKSNTPEVQQQGQIKKAPFKCVAFVASNVVYGMCRYALVGMKSSETPQIRGRLSAGAFNHPFAQSIYDRLRNSFTLNTDSNHIAQVENGRNKNDHRCASGNKQNLSFNYNYKCCVRLKIGVTCGAHHSFASTS